MGSVLSPGQSARFAATFRTAAPPSQVQLNSFGFHTAGRPQCVGRAA